ncbi:GTP cyclohydrolase II [Aliidiomarina maris]|uniref:GTP cyclohydrolase-2 n=1 Tax=Aliidiomarina maris TaxID=531312 RepID=A0A327X4G2_9GAMM|nr:GTP cyclohydrolase II [Aliidiomarina maris]MBA3988545.1 GTP cyclohydrolase II [Idiomarina sp.]MCL5049168.1 GTP cyclohydrolase II [Bacillota bacterium]RAK00589.1 GTP cyclohydrolase II [Aliidiomarina maris]RUO27398.1 GTP cyclohydrolase II [Aliidiomarina maris]
MQVKIAAKTKLPTPFGEFELIGFETPSGQEHVALAMGDYADGQPVLARVHSECLTGDALFSQRCDCGPQLEAAMQKIAAEKRGIIVYLRQEGRGIGLINKLRAYAEQDKGLDTVEANEILGFLPDARDYNVAAAMLEALQVKQIRLLTNNPDKLKSLLDAGINVIERVPHKVDASPHNQHYLDTKTKKFGHLL